MFQFRGQVPRIVMLEKRDLSFDQFRSEHAAGMVLFVHKKRVAAPYQRFDHGDVRVEAAAHDDARFKAVGVAQRLLELPVDGVVAVDEHRRLRRVHLFAFDAPDGRFEQFGLFRQSQVIVGSQVRDVVCENAAFAVASCALEGGQLFRVIVHGSRGPMPANAARVSTLSPIAVLSYPRTRLI